MTHKPTGTYRVRNRSPQPPRCEQLVSSLPSSSLSSSDKYSQAATWWRADMFLNAEQDTSMRQTKAETQKRGRLMWRKVRSPKADSAGHTGYCPRGRTPDSTMRQPLHCAGSVSPGVWASRALEQPRGATGGVPATPTEPQDRGWLLLKHCPFRNANASLKPPLTLRALISKEHESAESNEQINSTENPNWIWQEGRMARCSRCLQQNLIWCKH